MSGRWARRPGAERALEPALEATVTDLGYIGLTILVFGVLYLILKGVERFER